MHYSGRRECIIAASGTALKRTPEFGIYERPDKRFIRPLFTKDYCPEGIALSVRGLPGARRKPCLVADAFQILFQVPVLFYWYLREKHALPSPSLKQDAVTA
jgi:hypothetical protein